MAALPDPSLPNLLGHPQVVLAVVAGVAWLFNGIRRALKGRPAPNAEGTSGNQPETEAEQRTRQVREEVQRRIAARRRPASPILAPRPVAGSAGPLFPRRGEAEFRPGQPPAPPPSFPSTLPPAIERTEGGAPARISPWAEKRAASTPPLPASGGLDPVPPSRTAGLLLAELREPGPARRAILMREILGTPVGLR
jgi:hypothetical protein